MEVSAPFTTLNIDAVPLGPILELGVKTDQSPLTAERAGQAVEYWRGAAEKLISDSQSYDALYPRLAYAKMATEQAELLLQRGFASEAEQALRLANEVGVASPDATFRLVGLLQKQERFDEAIAVIEAAERRLPDAERLQAFDDKIPLTAEALRLRLEELRQQRKPR
jgi:tetratricopeptide (TPR) repeat protein